MKFNHTVDLYCIVLYFYLTTHLKVVLITLAAAAAANCSNCSASVLADTSYKLFMPPAFFQPWRTRRRHNK